MTYILVSPQFIEKGTMVDEEVLMAVKDEVSQETHSGAFICGVVEGFYGRPWTTEQRKDLFRKLKVWGMNSYVYAPKDDYKHRAYWRELYTVEEADHLTSLISAAREQNIIFYYALSPGLDITYSNSKELATLKRKLEQVSQFGCEAFALLFDDIESEMSKSDKEVFQSFAHAQVSVTNEVVSHLNNPKFLFCPTQYCSTRAVPTVAQSEYLNTIGSKLDKDISILWTGSRVISKIITHESIQEITDVLRRPPVIWDNLHANDYDQKRVFLGPYSGRSPELKPLLKGVLTNPNCEFHANTIGIHTLAQWSKCDVDVKLNNCSISADIKLETENEEGMEEAPAYLSKNIYHPRLALKNAILDWLPEFFTPKDAWGPITKPHPPVTMVMPIMPIIPSINTCMSLTTTTATSTTVTQMTVPEVKTTQLHTFADVCSTVVTEPLTPLTNIIMNSLVSPTKVITNDSIRNPILHNKGNLLIPETIPVTSIQIPIMSIKQEEFKTINMKLPAITNNLDAEDSKIEDISNDIIDLQHEERPDRTLKDSLINEDVALNVESNKINALIDENVVNMINNNETETMNVGDGICSMSPVSLSEPMECGGNSIVSLNSPRHVIKMLNDDVNMSENNSTCSAASMQVEMLESHLNTEHMVEDEDKDVDQEITADDIALMCDLFYLPFEHGGKALLLLNEFYWLKTNANILVEKKTRKDEDVKPEFQEWYRRSEKFIKYCNLVTIFGKKLANCPNKELCYDLYSYVWDIASVISLLTAFVKWLALGHFPANINSFTQGSYTWFSKGWKETFMSGDQEPWVFRGGLTADLQRLMPVDSGNDLFVYKTPDTATTNFYIFRPYEPNDEEAINLICHKTCRDGSDCSELFPENLQSIPADRLVGPFLTINPEFCIVAEDSNNKIVGYACAALDAKVFYRSQEMCWIPAMCIKYPLSILEAPDLTQAARDSVNHFHNFKYDGPPDVLNSHASIMTCCILKDQINSDESVYKRLVTILLAALRSNGSFGVHVCINQTDYFVHQFYSKLGFQEIYHDPIHARVFLGRNF